MSTLAYPFHGNGVMRKAIADRKAAILTCALGRMPGLPGNLDANASRSARRRQSASKAGHTMIRTILLSPVMLSLCFSACSSSTDQSNYGYDPTTGGTTNVGVGGNAAVGGNAQPVGGIASSTGSTARNTGGARTQTPGGRAAVGGNASATGGSV